MRQQDLPALEQPKVGIWNLSASFCMKRMPSIPGQSTHSFLMLIFKNSIVGHKEQITRINIMY